AVIQEDLTAMPDRDDVRFGRAVDGQKAGRLRAARGARHEDTSIDATPLPVVFTPIDLPRHAGGVHAAAVPAPAPTRARRRWCVAGAVDDLRCRTGKSREGNAPVGAHENHAWRGFVDDHRTDHRVLEKTML